jgi:type II secretory pathway component PulK
MKRAYRDEEGVVLLLVLVVIVLTIISVYAFARTAVLEVIGMRQSADHDRAELLARSGLELAYRVLADALPQESEGEDGPLVTQLETSQDAWSLLGEVPIPVPGEGKLRVSIRDAGSRLSLNGLLDADGQALPESRAFLMAALERIIENMPGRPEEKPYEPEELADAILDWIDSDDTTRMGDDEASSYERLRAAGRPLDRPILTLRELADLPEMDGALLAELAQYFTAYPLFPILGGGGVNPNTAPPHVLGLIYYGTEDDRRLADEEDVFRILRAREEGRVFCSGEDEERCVTFASETERAGETVFPPLALSAQVFTIESRAQVREARARIVATIERGDAAAPRLLEYRFE